MTADLLAVGYTPGLRDRPRVPLTPLVARRLLRFELERLLTDAGVTHGRLADWWGVSRPAVSLVMGGQSLLRQPALEVLCVRLDRTDVLPRLAGLLRAARRKSGGPDTPLASLPRDAELVVGLEAFAEQVTVFDPWLVPVHLQTQMYAAALTKLDTWTVNRAREQRQTPLLDTRDPLTLSWITSEHALRRRIGGTLVMDDQQTFLVQLADQANVEIRVIPATTELPPISPFQIVHGTPKVVVEPSRLTLHYACDPGTVTHFEHLAEELTQRALGTEDSTALIREIRP